MSNITQRIAVKALITNKVGQVLLMRVSDTPKAGGNAGAYTVPGGKVKAGEAWDMALKREVLEETGQHIIPGQPFRIGEWRPKVGGIQLQIIGVFIVCEADGEDVELSAENDDYQWVDSESLQGLRVLEPDCSVVKDYLRKHNSSKQN